MNRFIKLSNRIINTAHIVDIHVDPNNYTIFLNSVKHYGFFIFSFGSLDSRTITVDINKEKDKDDFHIVSEWINELNKKAT